jgi:hypothetical protein
VTHPLYLSLLDSSTSCNVLYIALGLVLWNLDVLFRMTSTSTLPPAYSCTGSGLFDVRCH